MPGSAVPANATLLSAVDLVGIVNVSVPAIPSVNTVGTGLEVEDLLVGDGEAVEPGDTVSVHYLGSLVDGTVVRYFVEQRTTLYYSNWGWHGDPGLGPGHYRYA